MAGWEESLKFPSRAHGSWIQGITSLTWSGMLGVMWKIQQALCVWAGWGGEVDKEGKCSQRETESKISHDSQPLVFTAPGGPLLGCIAQTCFQPKDYGKREGTL